MMHDTRLLQHVPADLVATMVDHDPPVIPEGVGQTICRCQLVKNDKACSPSQRSWGVPLATTALVFAGIVALVALLTTIDLTATVENTPVHVSQNLTSFQWRQRHAQPVVHTMDELEWRSRIWLETYPDATQIPQEVKEYKELHKKFPLPPTSNTPSGGHPTYQGRAMTTIMGNSGPRRTLNVLPRCRVSPPKVVDIPWAGTYTLLCEERDNGAELGNVAFQRSGT